MSSLKQDTHNFIYNSTYMAELYESYLLNPSNVSADWQEYFAQIGDNLADVANDFGKEESKVVGAKSIEEDAPKKGKGKPATAGGAVNEGELLSVRTNMLIRAYRVRGHLLAKLDPLEMKVLESHPELDPAHYGIEVGDYDKEVTLGGWLELDKATIKQVLAILQETYCSHIGVEYIHIQSLKRKEWLENKMESTRSKPVLSKERKQQILQKLVEVVGFEEFLHKKYPGAKRFSAEGGENLMTAMEAAVEVAANTGTVDEVVIGMPHRGRLNVLTAFMGKPYKAMLSEFQGNLAIPDEIEASGDVKYHLGISSDKKFGEKEVHLSLTPNPSHLEAVNPVVQGKVRAKQDKKNDPARDKVMGILLHGDAAFCGQGIVAESLALNDLEAYKTGGTFHIVVNNQIGFTTLPESGHTSPYPTDVAFGIQAPVFHVNGDDPEAVFHAASIAEEFRHTFKKDVVLDMWCYRKYGHNEGDEPRFTQPKMYEVISKKKNPRDIYAEQLIANGTVTQKEFDDMKDAFYQRMDAAYQVASDYVPEKADMLEGDWEGMRHHLGDAEIIETGVKKATLNKLGEKLVNYPEDFKLHKGVDRVVKAKTEMINKGEGLDWATGEALAFASLQTEGHKVRITGQDVLRGTFSHRHSQFTDQNTEVTFQPLNNLSDEAAEYEAHNSNLSEFAVLGFEYGYSTSAPNALTIWEAQFGDFYNGAQIIVDQFISSAETKWLRMSGLVMLLPHGYEGQGPEHSSTRIERFLQSSAEDNWVICNLTTPANYFHALRRQLKRDFRKPLIIASPKSLLRHKLATSSLAEMEEGTHFWKVIGEQEKLDAKKVDKIVLCTGKIYYDLLEERETRKAQNTALIRVEQLYPFPEQYLAEECAKFPNATKIVWAQEEPENMGAWNYIDRRIEDCLANNTKLKNPRPSVAARPASASTAAGYMKVHKKEHAELMNKVFS